jgi:hypothetical protein
MKGNEAVRKDKSGKAAGAKDGNTSSALGGKACAGNDGNGKAFAQNDGKGEKDDDETYDIEYDSFDSLEIFDVGTSEGHLVRRPLLLLLMEQSLRSVFF